MYFKEMFAERLKKARESQGLTQKELAKKTKISRESIGSYESSVSLPQLEGLVDLSKGLNVSCKYLLGLIDLFDDEKGDINNIIGLDDEAIETLMSMKNDEFEMEIVNAFIKTAMTDIAKRTRQLIHYLLINEELFDDEDTKDTNYYEAKNEYYAFIMEKFKVLIETYPYRSADKNLSDVYSSLINDFENKAKNFQLKANVMKQLRSHNEYSKDKIMTLEDVMQYITAKSEEEK